MWRVARGSERGIPGTASENGEPPTLPVAAVARRLGVAPATLRTWDRRYGLGPREHASGRHRRYGPADIARLEVMRKALLRGASSADAARYALASELPAAEPVASGLGTSDLGPGELDAGSPRGASARPGFARAVKGLCRATRALDSLALREQLDLAIAEHGVLDAWERVIEPVFDAFGDDTDASAGAYLLAECVLAALLRPMPAVSASPTAPPVLLCSVAAEQGGLPMYLADAALRGVGLSTRLLGAVRPISALLAAAERLAPPVIAVWARHSRSAEPEYFQRLGRLCAAPRLVAYGPGWQLVPLPAAVHRAASPREVLDRVHARIP
ncbi:MerR-like DNA binding protein [Tamaricihabitans halophyticus]|uniref:MerR-like DNA binding protein n=1 Tax=Tamaricihabitans halophyticus TaxID=1262583 RepID=A0A4R2QJ76_9PSEU|nr:MerR family transcriptional regulator [Tamaricihabitans halophyticus]TCP49422.1 MerR-like DNA binding protein [Tamaricihabitans halophyticus]